MVLTDINQLWIADITYIRLREEFVYLAVDSGCLLAPGDRLGAGPHAGDELTLTALHMALSRRSVTARPGASFRSRHPVRQPTTTPTCSRPARHSHQHEPQRQSLRQRGLRVVHENAEVRGGLPQRVSRPGRRARLDRASSSRRSTTRNACTRRWAICHRPSSRRNWQRKNYGGRFAAAFCMSFLRHREIYRSDVGFENAGSRIGSRSRRSSASMSFQLAIPRRVALQQRPPPLRQPAFRLQ